MDCAGLSFLRGGWGLTKSGNWSKEQSILPQVGDAVAAVTFPQVFEEPVHHHYYNIVRVGIALSRSQVSSLIRAPLGTIRIGQAIKLTRVWSSGTMVAQDMEPGE